jgi:hypothetical protein
MAWGWRRSPWLGIHQNQTRSGIAAPCCFIRWDFQGVLRVPGRLAECDVDLDGLAIADDRQRYMFAGIV